MKNILGKSNFGFTKWGVALIAAGWMGAGAFGAPIAINGNGTYSQSFDSLPNSANGTWTDDSTIAGWFSNRTGTASSVLNVGTGSGNAGGLYSFGSSASSDRALGSLGSTTPKNIFWGVQFQNSSSSPAIITTLSYTGEQWRDGGATTPAAQIVTFWYKIFSTAITSLDTADTGWTAVTALDFTSPIFVNTSTGAALDGNATANKRLLSSAVNVSVPAGSFIVFRWKDIDHTGSDHGLSIDNVSVAYTVSSNAPPSLAAANPATVDASFDVAFTDDSAWRNAISSITVGGSALPTAAYTKTVAGKITFNPSQSTLLQSAGDKSIVVQASGYSGATVTQPISAGAATQMAITTQPTAPSFNGGTLAIQPVVTLRDQYGNTSTSTDNVTVTQGGGGAWALGGGLTVAAIDGVATFNGLTAGHTVALTGATLSFSSGILEPVSSSAFNIPAPVAPTLAAAPSATVDGPFAITFTDNSAWRLAISAVRVASTTLDSSLYVVSEGQITLTPSASALLQTSGEKSISVTASGYAPATVTQTLGAGVANKLVLTTQPVAPATNGGALATQPIVKFADQYDNLTTSGTGDVTAAVGTGSYTLGGNPTISPSAGVATFTDLTAGAATALSGVTISFSSGSLTGVTSGTFNIPAPLAPTLAAAVSATVDADFVVTYSSNSNWQNAITGITVGGQAMEPAAYFVADGQITFKPSASTLLQSADSKTIAVNATGYSATSVTQPLGAGVATKLAVTTQPTAPVTNGGVLAAQPVVRFQDQYNNNTSGTADVTAAPANGGTWTLGGSTTVTPAGNIATFSGLTAANSVAALTGAAIEFSAAGVQSVTSNTFDIPPPPPANDLSDNAITLPLDGTAVSGTMAQATVSAPFAGVSGGVSLNVSDVWYQFTPSQSGAIFIQANTTSSALDLFVYADPLPATVSSGSTGSLTLAGGAAVASTTVKKTTVFVQSGQKYYVRVALNSASNTAQAFTISATANFVSPLVAWDFTNENTLATSSAEIVSSNLDSSGLLSRGLTAPASSGANSFRTAAGSSSVNGFRNDGINVSNTDYFEFVVSAKTGFKVSLQNIAIKLNGTANYMDAPNGVSMQFAYSLDGQNFILIGTAVATSDYGVPFFDITSVSALQNVPANTTVTFRYYASGQTATGGWGFNSPAAGQYGLYVTGTTSAENVAPTDISLTATSIAENNEVNASVGTLSTTDADSADTFTYSLVVGSGDTDNASFNISGNSLRAGVAFDFETKSSYTVRVRTTDSGGATFETTFTITVANVVEGSTYSSWLGIGTPSDEAFLDYVFGAATPGTLNPTLKPSVAVTDGNLVLTYHVRQGTVGLTVTPKTSADLAAGPSGWVTTDVTIANVGAAREVNGVIVQQKTASVPVSGTKKFLKVEAVQE